ncbi:MAG: hypothetical protein LBH26_05415 [Treponema sp.]|jgi:hypothetical protein|nr:hypothetical protein [Treponema sp.]
MKRVFPLLLLPFLLISCASFERRATRVRSSHPNFIADLDPVSVGAITGQFQKLLSSSLERKDINVYFVPRTDEVYLEFKYQTLTFRQYWEKTDRLQFITALERYKKDYSSRELNLKGARARRVYGRFDGKTEGGQVNTSLFMNSRSFPVMELGYQFKKTSPYFTVNMQASPDVLSLGDDFKRDSLDVMLYLTRAQGDELIALFDQQHLLSFVGPRASPEYYAPETEEEYQETESGAPEEAKSGIKNTLENLFPPSSPAEVETDSP